MNDASGVYLVQRARQALGQAQRVERLQATLLEPAIEAHAFDPLHREVRAALAIEAVMDVAHHASAVHAGQGLRFAREALGVRAIGAHDLDRDRRAGREVERAQDRAHRAFAGLGLDPKTPVDELTSSRGHGAGNATAESLSLPPPSGVGTVLQQAARPMAQAPSRVWLIATAFALAAAAGCDTAAEPSDAGHAELDAAEDAAHAHDVLVGEVEGSDVRVGVLASGDQLRVFLCGGPSSYASATHWVRTALDASGDLRFSSDALQLEGSLADGVLDAELITDDERALVRARAVHADTIAGLYEAQAECGTVGLIVTQDTPDSSPTAQGACVGDGHLPDQVNPIKPISLEQGAIAVEVVHDDEATRVRVRAASL